MSSFTPLIHPWNQQIWQDLTSEPERSNHALLFGGNSGLGKLDLAFSLTHFVLTETHDRSESLFNAGSHPDLHVIAPEYALEKLESSSNELISAYAKRYIEKHTGKPKQSITIDQVRRLSQALTTHPHVSKTRIVLIVQAEAMNRNAANALLKNLEEPPANTLFIIVSDELSQLAKTIRSRCSLIHFRIPEQSVAKTWLTQQGHLPADQIGTYLAIANNNPLQAVRLFEREYLISLKSIFTGVNSLWSQSKNPTEIAKEWQAIGNDIAIDTLQKMVVDLIKLSIAQDPKQTFFPVQRSWLAKVSNKLDQLKLVDLSDKLNDAKKQLSTSVDELLILESIALQFIKLTR